MKEYNALHRALCFTTSPVGRLVHWISTAIKSPDVEIPIENGEKSITVLCPCCVFYRGLLVGGVAGLLVGYLL